MFFRLKDKPYLLEYAKHVITKNNNPSAVWYTTNEETPSWALSTVKKKNDSYAPRHTPIRPRDCLTISRIYTR